MASGLLLMSTNALSGSENAALSSKLTVRTVYILSLIHILFNRNLNVLGNAEHARLLERMDRVVMVSENYHKGCYLRRDEYMVRKADTVLSLIHI